MGRWAQRRHGAGSGGAASPPLNSITTATRLDPNTAILSYASAIDATLFDGTEFTSNPSASTNVTVVQESPAELRLIFGDDISLDVSVTYIGTAPGVLSPQTVLYT